MPDQFKAPPIRRCSGGWRRTSTHTPQTLGRYTERATARDRESVCVCVRLQEVRNGRAAQHRRPEGWKRGQKGPALLRFLHPIHNFGQEGSELKEWSEVEVETAGKADERIDGRRGRRTAHRPNSRFVGWKGLGETGKGPSPASSLPTSANHNTQGEGFGSEGEGMNEGRKKRMAYMVCLVKWI